MKYWRFQLAFDGEPQGVGFLTGIEDVGLPGDKEVDLLDEFQSLPCPTVYCPCEFWFTAEGVHKYRTALQKMAEQISPYNWTLTYAMMDASVEDYNAAVYKDALQIAWDKKKVPNHDTVEYKELENEIALLQQVIIPVEEEYQKEKNEAEQAVAELQQEIARRFGTAHE